MISHAAEPPLRSLPAFVGLTFGIAWGVMGFALAFQDAVEAVLGPMRASHPLFILAVWAPAISAILLVLWHGGLPGVRRYLSRLLLWRAPIGWYLLLLIGLPAIEVSYLDEMLAGVETGAPGRSYGLGVGIDRTGTDEVRGHGGWIPGYVGSLRYYPAQNVAIAIQINSDIGMLGPGGAFDAIERAISAAILGMPE